MYLYIYIYIYKHLSFPLSVTLFIYMYVYVFVCALCFVCMCLTPSSNQTHVWGISGNSELRSKGNPFLNRAQQWFSHLGKLFSQSDAITLSI